MRVSARQTLRVVAALALTCACKVQGPQRAATSGEGQGTAGEFYLLGIFRPTGGTIVSSDARINCGVDGDACGDASLQTKLLWNETTTLTARAAPGFRFEGWAGDCSGKGDCFVSSAIKHADWYVVANFVPDAAYRGVYFVVIVDRPAGGTIRSTGGQLECGTGGTRCGPTLFPWSGDATLVAEPDAGNALQGWTGDCSAASGATCVLDTATFATDKTVGALFAPSSEPGQLVWDQGSWDQGTWQ